MNCETACDMMGAYVDHELASADVVRFEEHLRECPACAVEVRTVEELAGRLRDADPAPAAFAPPALWGQIAGKLDGASPQARVHKLSWLRRPMALAASFAMLIGLGAFVAVWLSPGQPAAQATTVDYAVLLDQLPEGVDTAVSRFLRHYGAEPIARDEVAAHASGMRLAVPAELHGGFHLAQTYRLKFGAAPGIAARYNRGDEPLFVFFHPPVGHVMGIHRESQCHVAGREGQRVEVGPWRLIHFTDPTTCHCLLSRLERPTDIDAVMAAVAPDFSVQTRPGSSPG